MFRNGFVNTTVRLLGTFFTIPEEEIISQDEEGKAMYFISKGDCAVNIKDQNGILHVAINLLVEGDHFGEVSLIYKIKRTATVISRNYNTMARMSYPKFRELVYTFPEYLKLLKINTFYYND